VWKHLDHPNVVALKGITLNPLQLVSEWMSGGELRDYIKQNPNANRINLVGSFLPLSHIISPSPQLLGVAEGLAYLHSCSVVHGDLKGVRVITYLGTPFLTEAGIAKHRGGRIRKCTNHGLGSHKHHSGSTLGTERFRWSWLHPLVDRTRDLAGRHSRKQEVRYILVWDDYL